MNNLQPEHYPEPPPFDDDTQEMAWGEVENVFHAAGMTAPLPGFSDRFLKRLELQRQREERKQALALILTNLVIALGFIILIGVGFLPSLGNQGGPVNLWVGMVSRIIIGFKMVGGLATTMLRTLPGVVPSSWWVTAIGLLGIVVALWVSIVRRHVQIQGVQHE